MRVIKASAALETPIDGPKVLQTIERIGRVCYKSEDRITEDSAVKFCRNIIGRGHESMIEHQSASFRVVCDRGVSHELVRHRLASYAQESSRYCNYSQSKFGSEITVIKPCFLEEGTKGYAIWYNTCKVAEGAYFDLLDWGCSPEEARDALPTSLKTEIVMTANFREWRHFVKLRTSRAAHPQMREVARLIFNELYAAVPVLFEDIKTDIAQQAE